MANVSGTAPHFIKVQVGDSPSPEDDGQASINLPLDESPEGVAVRLAKIAQAMLALKLKQGGAVPQVTITKVDNSPCRVAVTDTAVTPSAALVLELSKLVAPRGWRPG